MNNFLLTKPQRVAFLQQWKLLQRNITTTDVVEHIVLLTHPNHVVAKLKKTFGTSKNPREILFALRLLKYRSRWECMQPICVRMLIIDEDQDFLFRKYIEKIIDCIYDTQVIGNFSKIEGFTSTWTNIPTPKQPTRIRQYAPR